MKEEILRLENLSKYNRGKQQFSDINLTICRGEMVGIASDNLRVLWILFEIMKGETIPDGGTIYLEHERRGFEEARTMLRKKVFFLEGLKTYGGDLKVLDLFYAANIPGPIWGRKKWIWEMVEKSAAGYGIPLPPSGQRAEKLSALDQCRMELLRAVICGATLVVLVDVSSFLNPADYTKLMDTVTAFEQVGISFLMFDHMDRMLVRYTQRLVLLADGTTRYVLTDYAPDHLEAVFHTAETIDGWKSDRAPAGDPPVFSIERLETDNFKEFHLEIHRGEVVGLVEPATYIAAELVDVLKGKVSYREGKFRLNGSPWHPEDEYGAIHQGIAFVPENPVQSGHALLTDMSVLDNLLLTISEKRAGVRLNTYRKSIRMECEKFFGRDIADQKAGSLDLLDQQRLVFFRWMLYYPSLLVIMHPFSGSNLYMMQVTHQMIRLCGERNISVLVLENSASEAYGVCDRMVFLE